MTYGRTMRLSRSRTASALASFAPHWKFIKKSRRAGWFVGINPLTGQAVYMAPHRSMASGDSASAEYLFVGVKGVGKTAAMKIITMTLTQEAASDLNGELSDFRVFIDNRKPDEENGEAGEIGYEWQNIIETLHCEILTVETMSFELFDPDSDDSERLIAALDTAEFIKKSPLSPYEKLSVIVGLSLHPAASNAPFTVADFEHTLSTLNYENVKAFNASLDKALEDRYGESSWDVIAQARKTAQTRRDDSAEIFKAASMVASYFKQILCGAYGHTFMGTSTLADHMRRPAVMFDLNQMTNDQVTLFELMRFHTMRTALRRGDMSVIPHLMVREEIQEAVNNIVLLRRWAEWSAKARALHTITLNSTQFLTNLMTGEPGSDTERYLRQIFSGFDTFVIFQQPDNDATKKILSDLGLSKPWIEHATKLPMGEQSVAIIKPRLGQPEQCQFVATPTVAKLIRSRGAATRMAAGNKGGIAKRLEELERILS